MSTSQISMSGAIVLWSTTSTTSLDKLTSGLDGIGLGKFAPSQTSPQAALKAAMTDLYAGPRKLIRPDRTGFSVVEETEHPVLGLQHEVVLTALPRMGQLEVSDPAEQDRVVNAYAHQLDLVPVASITASLTAIVRHLGGIALRQTGGIYWIPARSTSKWAQVMAVVQSAGANTLYAITTQVDAESVRAVCDAINSEMAAEVAQMQSELADGLSARAGKRRAEQLSSMTDRLRDYEQSLGVTLDTLRGALVTLDQGLMTHAGADDWGAGSAISAFGSMFD